MAESHRSKSVDAPDLADDDPFAELTRIMGHDPRAASARPAEEASDDLEIDLENELLGELGGYAGQEAANTARDDEDRADAASAGEEAEPDLQDDIDAAFDSVFGDETAFAESDTPATGHVSGEADEPGGEPQPDEAEAADDRFAVDLEDELNGLIVEDAEDAAGEPPAEPVPADDPVAVDLEGELDALAAGEGVDDPVVAAPDENPGSGAEAEDEPFDYSWAAAERHDALAEEASPHVDARATVDHESGAAEDGDVLDYSRAAAELHGVLSEDLDTTSEEPGTEGQGPEAAAPLQEAAATTADGPADPPAREPSADDDDPFGILAGMRAAADRAEEAEEASARRVDIAAEPPEIDTVEVPGEPVAVADDLDLPEIAQRDETPPATEFDELESELAGAFGEVQAGTDRDPGEGGDDSATRTDGDAGTAYGAGAVDPALELGQPGESDAYLRGGFVAAGDGPDLSFDPSVREEMAGGPADEAGQRGGSRRRGFIIAAVVVGVAIIGGVAAFALSDGGDSGAPALVRADDSPVKVQPEDPGGTTVPNQDGEVYQRVAGEDTETDPAQERLVSTTEEPIEVNARTEPRAVSLERAEDSEPADTGSGQGAASDKSEERLEPGADDLGPGMDDEMVAVAPRRVRTMTVRPDGTIVPREESSGGQAAASSEDATADTARDAALLEGAAGSDATGTRAPAAEDESALAAANSQEGTTRTDVSEPSGDTRADEAESANEAPAAATDSESALAAANTELEPASEDDGAGATVSVPENAPVPSSRPTPTTSEPDTGGQQVASTGPDETPGQTDTTDAREEAPASAWSVQISSQPTREGAERSYQDLAARYSNLLADRGVNIVPAEIPDRGTFYRVRIPSSSKDDAISLCESVKSAGGNCFVSQ